MKKSENVKEEMRGNEESEGRLLNTSDGREVRELKPMFMKKREIKIVETYNDEG